MKVVLYCCIFQAIEIYFNSLNNNLLLFKLLTIIYYLKFIYTLTILRRTAHLSHSRFCIWVSRILICRFFFLGLQTTCLLRREWSFRLLHWGWNLKSSRQRLCLSYIVRMIWIISNCRICWEGKSDNEWLYKNTFVSFYFVSSRLCIASQTQLSVISIISMHYLIHGCVFKGKIYRVDWNFFVNPYFLLIDILS